MHFLQEDSRPKSSKTLPNSAKRLIHEPREILLIKVQQQGSWGQAEGEGSEWWMVCNRQAYIILVDSHAEKLVLKVPPHPSFRPKNVSVNCVPRILV